MKELNLEDFESFIKEKKVKRFFRKTNNPNLKNTEGAVKTEEVLAIIENLKRMQAKKQEKFLEIKRKENTWIMTVKETTVEYEASY